MMSSSGTRGDPVAASSNGAFENRPGLALDAQTDCGLCYSTAWSAPTTLFHSEEERERKECLLSSWHILVSSDVKSSRCKTLPGTCEVRMVIRRVYCSNFPYMTPSAMAESKSVLLATSCHLVVGPFFVVLDHSPLM